MMFVALVTSTTVWVLGHSAYYTCIYRGPDLGTSNLQGSFLLVGYSSRCKAVWGRREETRRGWSVGCSGWLWQMHTHCPPLASSAASCLESHASIVSVPATVQIRLLKELNWKGTGHGGRETEQFTYLTTNPRVSCFEIPSLPVCKLKAQKKVKLTDAWARMRSFVSETHTPHPPCPPRTKLCS